MKAFLVVAIASILVASGATRRPPGPPPPGHGPQGFSGPGPQGPPPPPPHQGSQGPSETKPHHQCSHAIANSPLSTTVRPAQACTLFPESSEGPYYLDNQYQRSDITEGRAGVALTLNLQVLNYTTCTPISGVVVDLWQADAMGDYSGYNGNNSDVTSLRGYQITNSNGQVAFQTVIPGWYISRAIHIHTDVWVNNQKHVGQFFFDEQLTQQIARLSPYNQNRDPRTTNAQDQIYNQFRGDETLLDLTSSGTGYSASLIMGFQR